MKNIGDTARELTDVDSENDAELGLFKLGIVDIIEAIDPDVISLGVNAEEIIVVTAFDDVDLKVVVCLEIDVGCPITVETADTDMKTGDDMSVVAEDLGPSNVVFAVVILT